MILSVYSSFKNILSVCNRLLFWTDTGPNSQSIKSSTMMGSNVTTLVNLSSTAINITGLALDVSNQRLYWVQSDTSNILTCAYDGSGIQVLYAGSPSSSHRSVAVYQVCSLRHYVGLYN